MARKAESGFVLVIETGGGSGRVALLSGERVLFDGSCGAGRSRSEDVLSLVSTAISGQCKVRDLERVVVSAGPGSVTGLRIGQAIARGLADAAGVDVRAVSPFSSMLRNLSAATFPCAALLLSGRMLWGVRVDAFGAVGDPENFSPERLSEWVGEGETAVVMIATDWQYLSAAYGGCTGEISSRVVEVEASLASLMGKFSD